MNFSVIDDTNWVFAVPLILMMTWHLIRIICMKFLRIS